MQALWYLIAVLTCSCGVAVTPPACFPSLTDFFPCLWNSSVVSQALLGHSQGPQASFYDYGKGVRSRLQFHQDSLNEVWLSACSPFHSHFYFTASFDCFPWIQCSTCSWGEIGNEALLFSYSVESNSLWPHGLQHTRLPCPPLSPGVCSNSPPLSRWCHPTISSSATPFSSCPQSFPASEYFPVSRLFTSGGQNTGASTSASVLPMNSQGWFPSGLTGLILAVQGTI